MIIYALFGIAFIIALHMISQCFGVSFGNGRLTITEKPGPLVIAGLIRIDETEQGISFARNKGGAE
ncbi:MAG: hypothetical protein DRI57_10855 [Deltaproteobacteria bacterium]|nr:MAG: hypothetical protein DRI57_10855 [Deltaproteobacteria bacterium]